MNFGYGAAAAALVVAIYATSPVRAQDIKPGKWEYTTQMNMGNRPMPQIPPDKLAQMPPEMRAKIEQMMHGSVTYSSCITADMPVPKNPRGGECNVEQMERSGGIVRWRASCTMPNGRTTTAEATANYDGDAMTMDMTIHTERDDGRSLTMRQHVTGHYVGPCDS